MELAKFAEAALGTAIGRTLTLDCAKCTKLGVFTAMTRVSVIMKARSAGWRMIEGKEFCPSCIPPIYTNHLIHRFATEVINKANA